MNTIRRTAAILLVLSLAGRLSAWVPDHDGVDTILLPSHGSLANELVTGELKPPNCCELALCTRSFPPTCLCVDKVKECAATCRSCEQVEDSSLYMCRDSYTGYPDPMCAKSVTTTGPPTVAGHEATAGAEAAARPCCDLQRCTRSFPPTCQCMDKMDKCPNTCKLCQTDEASSLVVCLDQYDGNTACTPAAPPPPAEQDRPWECCDLVRCTRSFPPTCQCMDKVKKCAKACKSCQKVEGSSSYVCGDSYRGEQGPACTTTAPTFTPRGN